MTDEQKAERKTLIENNKAMESATKVRRDFVKTSAGQEAGSQGLAVLHRSRDHPPFRNRQRLRRKGRR
jgi:ParB family chromosome partitioning protein